MRGEEDLRSLKEEKCGDDGTSESFEELETRECSGRVISASSEGGAYDGGELPQRGIDVSSG